MSDGTGCECYASNASECCCDNVDWRSAREIELEVENAQLRKQLAAALAACEAKDTILRGITLYRAFNGDDWPAREATHALAIKPDASALKAHDIAVFRKGAEYAFEVTGGNGGLTVSDEEVIRELREGSTISDELKGV